MEMRPSLGIKNQLAHTFTLAQCLKWWGLTLVILILGAHFYRAGQGGLTLSILGILLFHCSNMAWKNYAVGFFLLWGAWEWADTARHLAQFRMAMGLPWARAMAILLGVGMVTLMSGLYALRYSREKAHHHTGEMYPLFKGVVFISCFLLLFYLRSHLPFTLLLLERYVPVWGSVQIFLAAWYAAWLGGLLLAPHKSRSARRTAWIFFSVIFFGQLALGLMGMDLMLMTGTLHIPVPAFILLAPLFRGSFSMMPALVLLAVLLTGTAWCSLLCYFGPLDSLAGGKKQCLPAPAWLEWGLKWGRPVILGLGVIGALALRFAGVNTQTALICAGIFTLIGLLFMVMVSQRYGGMVHCTTFCPMGLVITLLGKCSPWRMQVNIHQCTHCGACEHICQYRAITPESRTRGKTLSSCTLCRDCMGGCSKKALSLRAWPLPASTTQPVFVGLITILHVLFLNIARV